MSNPYQPPVELPEDELEDDVPAPENGGMHDRFMIALCFALSLFCGGIALGYKSWLIAVMSIAISFVGATYLENSKPRESKSLTNRGQ